MQLNGFVKSHSVSLSDKSLISYHLTRVYSLWNLAIHVTWALGDRPHEILYEEDVTAIMNSYI